jgi:hypothetical protein
LTTVPPAKENSTAIPMPVAVPAARIVPELVTAPAPPET